ncbi:hypothetical protein RhiirC2_792693 [Rhizophagus irregularis]|uniref:Uncharacterized protein n=1 Tax=Rhizophagus irregularis TaxID=588596 RepID=A0A2N1MGX0_9GLOM|nr:hypothetical protein RhiirC2_792693 [Rhizophagus irregularis]
MSDIYDELEEIKNRHEIEKHNESREKYQVDPSCLKCYNGKERYPSSKKKRNKESEKIRKEGEKLLNIVVRSIRYRNKPDYRKIGIISVIKVICQHYILSEDNEFILDNQTEDNLLENKELLTYKYIIEDNELDIRFAKFKEWLEKIELATIRYIGYGTIRDFKEILHLEENIAEEENREKVKKFQKKKIVKTKCFVEKYNDIGELEKNGYEIDIKEIKKIINFGVNYEIIKTKEFMNFYKTIEELDDKGIKEELKIWQYMYTIECLSCNKMILTKEAVEYNKKFIERICKNCYEKELENLKDENGLNNEIEIEKRLE